ncbi:Molybdopterin synthase sulfur carrier subunit [Myriangium duriaei CBS 260.36]|uniref:Molybdopterin synthase sulfur carrier subunit n=1 Tax=Myriangium duriaei CBS 260.36 TaxID=1168546 RepID=A0A9P4J3P3_9PEZI|nr:Molybdopterin synthase sulfur carrier subunit [Myriangium duriaei CBS 260.36]
MVQSKPPSGHFNLLFFASAQTCTRKASETLAAPMTVAELMENLEQRYPGMQKILQSSALTINLDYVDDDSPSVVINDGDEVAIIPPVSSG